MIRDVNFQMEIKKSSALKNLVFGWASVYAKADGTVIEDHDKDQFASMDVLEKAAYDHVLNFGSAGEMHRGYTKGRLIESIAFTYEKMEMMGIEKGIVPQGWWVGFKIDDEEVMEKIRSGEYTMFSIQGKARTSRIPDEEDEE